jgi:hypothetical protein
MSASLLIKAVFDERRLNARFLETIVHALSKDFKEATESYNKYLSEAGLLEKGEETAEDLRTLFESAKESLKGK